jgi:hypothetical protein
VKKVFWLSATIPSGFKPIVESAFSAEVRMLEFPSQFMITKDRGSPLAMEMYAYSCKKLMF